MGICFLSDAFQAALIKKKVWCLWAGGYGEVWAGLPLNMWASTWRLGKMKMWGGLSSIPVLPPLLSSSVPFALQPVLKSSPYREEEETSLWQWEAHFLPQTLLCHTEEMGGKTKGVSLPDHKRCVLVRWNIFVISCGGHKAFQVGCSASSVPRLRVFQQVQGDQVGLKSFTFLELCLSQPPVILSGL